MIVLFTQKQVFWTKIFWIWTKSKLRSFLKMRFFSVGNQNRPLHDAICRQNLMQTSALTMTRKDGMKWRQRIHIHRVRRNTDLGLLKRIHQVMEPVLSHSVHSVLTVSNSFYSLIVFPNLLFLKYIPKFCVALPCTVVLYFHRLSIYKACISYW